MMNIDSNTSYQKFLLTTDEEKKFFFNYCLKNNLYKKYEFDPEYPDKTTFTSRMKRVYTGYYKPQAILAVLALKDGKPQGVAMLEFDQSIHQAKIIEKNLRCKNGYKLLKIEDFNIHYAGFISIYIKKSFRGKGIATTLFKKLENLVVENVQQHPDYKEKDLITYTCLEKSFCIAQKYATQSLPIDAKHTDFHFIYALNDISIQHKKNLTKYLDNFIVENLNVKHLSSEVKLSKKII